MLHATFNKDSWVRLLLLFDNLRILKIRILPIGLYVKAKIFW